MNDVIGTLSADVGSTASVCFRAELRLAQAMMTNVGSLSFTAAGPRVRHIDVLSDFLKETCAETKAAHIFAMWKQPVGVGQQGFGEFQDGRVFVFHSFAGRGSSSRGGW